MSGDLRDVSFRKALGREGFSFQQAVLRHCEELQHAKRSRWHVEAAEFPVELEDAHTRIDFVMHAYHPESARHAFLVCECKRANPSLAGWGFVRDQRVFRPPSHGLAIFEQVSLDHSQRVFANPIALAEPIEPYHVAVEVKMTAGGDSGGSGRGAIEAAATQALRGTSGLINVFKNHVKVVVVRTPAVVVPVIFTTAQVFASNYDIGTADLSSGTLADDFSGTDAPWLWFQYNLSAALKHSAPNSIPTHKLTKLGSLLSFQSSRSIAIVSPTGIESFLEEMPRNLEDLETLEAH